MIPLGGTKSAVVLGWPVEHSKSPVMHNAAFAELGVDAHYSAIAVEPKDLADAVRRLREGNTLGASITVPHKSAVMQHCDELSPAAKAIGAVNTLEFRDDGSICGHNTDAPGYVRALQDATGAALAGLRVVLLGGGGAARAVAYGLKEAGIASLRLIARTPSKVQWMQAEPWVTSVLVETLRDCDLLVDCTSMGLDAEKELEIPAPIPLDEMAKDGIVSTLVYHRQTKLLAEAERLGMRAVDGKGMLLFQGAVAFEIWTGQGAPVEAMRSALL
jgi:shikimate dehydrogenase